ncbi:MAG: lipid-A-disaccharide synthase [Dictyoglomus turgidum]
MKIFLSVLEVSADVHGSKLINALKNKKKDIYFYGLGGERMKEEGMEVMYDVTQYSTVGFIEPIPYIPKLLLVQEKVKKIIKETKPDLIIFIDAQGFNLPLAKYAKKLGIQTIYYFAPQYWLWGNQEKAREVLDTVSYVVATFPQEYNLYKKFGDNVVYFGHPLVDYLLPYENLEKENDLIGLFPGSRIQEIKNLVPLFLEISNRLKEEGYRFVMPIASEKFSGMIFRYIRGKNHIELVSGRESQKYLKLSSLSLVASGTVTLEAAILKTPVMVFYKISSITYNIAKRLVHYSFIALPNIILNQMIYPEFVQKIDIKEVMDSINRILKDEDYKRNLENKLRELEFKLGEPGVLERISKFILEII